MEELEGRTVPSSGLTPALLPAGVQPPTPDVLPVPILYAASPGSSTRIVGAVDVASGSSLQVNFYTIEDGNESADFDDGYLGSATITGNSNGTSVFDVTVGAATDPDDRVIANSSSNDSQTQSANSNSVGLGESRWINPLGGDWDTASNWSTGVVPGASDNAIVAIPGITVTHSTSSIDAVRSLSSQASVTISAGSLSLETSSSIAANVTLSGGTLGGDGDLSVSGTLDWTGGTLAGNGVLHAEGPVDFSATGLHSLAGKELSLESDTPTFDLQEGTLTGYGTIDGNVVNEAILSVTKTLVIHGDYTQRSAATLDVQLAGSNGGSGGTTENALASDTTANGAPVQISGDATLDGTLQLDLAESFTPTAGGSYPILAFAAHSGDFAARQGLVLNDGTFFAEQIGSTRVAVTYYNPPTITIQGDAQTTEGSTYTLKISHVDVTTEPAVTGYVVHWGDGTSGTYDSPGSVTHVYGDGPADEVLSLDAITSAGTFTNVVSQGVHVNDTAPKVNLSGAQQTTEGALYTLSVGRASSADEDPVIAYIVHWGDRAIDTYTAPGKVTHIYLKGNVDPSISVDVLDDDGLHTDVGNLEIHVQDVAPALPLSGASQVDEGSSYGLIVGQATDPDNDLVLAYIVHWGDGSTDTFTPPGSVNHTYAYGGIDRTITVDVLDEDGLSSDVASLPVTVNNVRPVVHAGGGLSITQGIPFLRNGFFVDPGVENWTATVNYGDGTGTQSLVLNPDHTFTLGHIYQSANVFQVTVKVTDGGGLIGKATFLVNVLSVSSNVQIESSDVETVQPGSTGGAKISDPSGTGVDASLTLPTNASSAAQLSVAGYSGNPTGGTAHIAVSAPGSAATGDALAFFDVRVTGLSATDGGRAKVVFYYPPTITGAQEAALQLLYFNGTSWVPMRSSGVHGLEDPIKNTTDVRTSDGVLHGGSFTMFFDSKSIPTLAALKGSVFTISVVTPAPTNATVTPALALAVPATNSNVVSDVSAEASGLSTTTSFVGGAPLTLALSASPDQAAATESAQSSGGSDGENSGETDETLLRSFQWLMGDDAFWVQPAPTKSSAPTRQPARDGHSSLRGVPNSGHAAKESSWGLALIEQVLSRLESGQSPGGRNETRSVADDGDAESAAVECTTDQPAQSEQGIRGALATLAVGVFGLTAQPQRSDHRRRCNLDNE